MRTDTVFRIASLTKSCTGLAAAILAERGAVKLDAPIGGFATGLSPADAVVDAVAASQPLRRRAR